MVVMAMLGGCSSAPRNYAPKLVAPAADAQAFEEALAVCRTQVAAGQRESFAPDRGTSTGVGVAVGAGVAVASAGAGGSMVAAAAAGVAGAAALLVIAPLAIFATARYIRSGKEDRIKQATGLCLAENGYPVEDWALADD